MNYAVRNDGQGWRAVNSITDIDSTIETFATSIPAPTAAQLLATAKTAQNAILTAAYTAAIQVNVAYMATTFQADLASQDRLSKVLVAGAVPADFAWRDVGNLDVAMTFVQAQGLAAAMLAQGWAAFKNLKTRKATVSAATTIAAVQAVVW
jgi:hypothetical protein